ncbi:hypothetical protein GOODEAATRI_030452 [Goodea atripinnis]|uniref:Uncharacterized protein n=1 Tax=Goodea atripinnis TaxID=208336 RepID=A0ABV0N5H4_9TELE
MGFTGICCGSFILYFTCSPKVPFWSSLIRAHNFCCRSAFTLPPLVVVLWTAVDVCSSFRVTMNLLVASLINVLLAQPVSLGGRPCLGRSAVGPSSLHVHMMD